MGTHEVLLLDPRIRDWVVLPMVLLMAMVGVGRSYVQQLIKSDPVIDEKEFQKIRQKQTVMRGDRLRINGSRFINKESYQVRKAYLTQEETGLLHEKVSGPNMNPMSNPNMMGDMLKGQLTFMLPNFALMGFVNNFFSGFVCLKVPFSLPSVHFKTMLQRGVDLSSLDVSYVSSISWYILLTFGLSGVYRLILDEGTEVDPGQMYQMQMGGMGGNQQFDAKGAYKNSRDMIAITRSEFPSQAVEAEKRVLAGAYPVAHADKVDLRKFA